MGGVFRAIGNLFGGGGSRVVYQQSAPQPSAQSAAPALDSAQKAVTEDTQVKKTRRGKASLLVNPADKKTTSSASTGLNI